MPVPPNLEPMYDGIGAYWAVLVGVGAYDDSSYHPLPVCVKDIKAVAKQLTQNGYDPVHMRLLVDENVADDPFIKQFAANAKVSKPTLGNIIDALQAVSAMTKPEDLFLFYYTGHGGQQDDEAYLVTHGGHRRSLKHTALSVSTLKEIIQSAAAKKKVIILDSCRSEAPQNSKGHHQLPPAFIERVFEQAQGSVILSSCGPGEESYVWEEREQSVFTYYLLEALQGKADFNKKNRVSADDIYLYVYEKVKLWAMQNNRTQTPKRVPEMDGSIIVAYYQQEHTSPPSATPENSVPVIPLRRATAHSWKDIQTITIHGEQYTLDSASVRERQTDDRGAILRQAKARHVKTDLPLWLKQVHIMGPFNDGKKLRKILQEERQILLDLESEECRDFPRVFPLIDDDSEIDYTVAYMLTNNTTLKRAFSGPGAPHDKPVLDRLVQSVLPLCEALSILHIKKRSHRCLNPDELFLHKGRYAMLQNIGLAAWVPREGEDAGLYRAPEQEKTSTLGTLPGPWTDIYQLGTLLYYLITGRYYSPGATLAYNKAASSQLDDIIARAVRRKPGDRWPTMDEFAAKLKQTLE